MSAPAALAMAKLMYPETEEPEFTDVDEIEIEETYVVCVLYFLCFQEGWAQNISNVLHISVAKASGIVVGIFPRYFSCKGMPALQYVTL